MSASGKLLNRVRELRARLKLRQADLAAEVGVTRQTIIAIEKGRFNPSVLVSLKIARVLREPVDYVFYLAPGTEAELTAAPQAANPKRIAKRGKGKGAPPKPKAAQEPVEVYDNAVKSASAAPETGSPSAPESPAVAIAAEAPPAETPLSVAPPQPEITEPAGDVESELEEAAEASPPPAPSATDAVEQLQEVASPPSEAPAEAEEPGDSEESPQPAASPEPAPSGKAEKPKQRETDTGQAIWDFV